MGLIPLVPNSAGKAGKKIWKRIFDATVDSAEFGKDAGKLAKDGAKAADAAESLAQQGANTTMIHSRPLI